MSIAISKIRAAAKSMKDAVGGDPHKARDLLTAEGVLTRGGSLTARYSRSTQPMAEFLSSATGDNKVKITLPKRFSAKGGAVLLVKRRSAKAAKPE